MDEDENIEDNVSENEIKYEDSNTLEQRVIHAKATIKEKHWCPYQYGGYHIMYCDLSENDVDVPCSHIGPKIIEHDGLEYHECKYSSERTEVKYK